MINFFLNDDIDYKYFLYKNLYKFNKINLYSRDNLYLIKSNNEFNYLLNKIMVNFINLL